MALRKMLAKSFPIPQLYIISKGIKLYTLPKIRRDLDIVEIIITNLSYKAHRQMMRSPGCACVDVPPVKGEGKDHLNIFLHSCRHILLLPHNNMQTSCTHTDRDNICK